MENGGKVLLNSQVVHVKQDLENKKTEVTYMDRTTGSYSTLSCDKVIMSTPPAITTQVFLFLFSIFLLNELIKRTDLFYSPALFHTCWDVSTNANGLCH